jgi:predicted DNA binding CopG/RHH family protein
MKYDKEERAIIDAYENDLLKLERPSEKEIAAMKRAARATLKKDKRVTIRLYSHDYTGIQKKAFEMGIPYQTLISGIIHRYIEGDLQAKAG